jgi:hypothetical protein
VTLTRYLLTLPERVVRSALGLTAGAAREVGEAALPRGVRETQLYQNLVDATLRFLIEQVGEAEGVYAAEGKLPDDFLARRTAGNALEVLGIVAFRASPVWILAAMADLSGMGRQLLAEIAEALKAERLLEPDREFTSVDQLLDGLERTSSRLAATVNTPPLDVAALRAEWNALRQDARTLQPESLPSPELIATSWNQLRASAARQRQSVFDTSTMMAMSAIRALPEQARWLSASARVGATRTGQIAAAALLAHYRATLTDIERVGFTAYVTEHLRPYVLAAMRQFVPAKRTLTERLLEKRWR